MPTTQTTPISVAIVGASGYTGGELLRLLSSHPHFEPVIATSRQEAGNPIRKRYPGLSSDLVFSEPDYQEIAARCQLAFVCLPHGAAAETVAILHGKKVKVVDLSADLRYDDPELYRKVYQTEPSALFGSIPYGLPEWNRVAIVGSSVVSNPGCYVTSALIALLPLVEAGVLQKGPVIIDAKSGVSGAGRSVKDHLLLSEQTENFMPYASWGHRHESEIKHRLETFGGKATEVVFSPHLLPVSRGIVSSIYCGIDLTPDKVRKLYQDRYNKEPFVHLLPGKVLPTIRSVVGSNRVDLQLVHRPETNQWIIFSALDNLTKGASGQAIQNANLMMGIKETTGLPVDSTWL